MSTPETKVSQEIQKLIEIECQRRLDNQKSELESDFARREAERDKKFQINLREILEKSQQFHRLTAISTLDGRYAEPCEPLREIFSEFALMRNRLKVEVNYLKALAKDKTFEAMPQLTDNEIEYLDLLVDSFSIEDAIKIKQIEKTTRHDVKALEYMLKDKIKNSPYEHLKEKVEMIHFGLTSEDTNSPAYSLMLKDFNQQQLIPNLTNIISKLCDMSLAFADTPMMSRTHGQPATPTTLGKELANFAQYFNTKLNQAKTHEFSAKLSGAIGCYNAQVSSAPKTNWPEVSKNVLSELGLAQTPMSTQTDSQESLITYAHLMSELAARILNFSQNAWLLISDDYLKQKILKGEVGSSTMPHKVNPIDFENAEGNMKKAIEMLDGLAKNLSFSRYQRDLSNSTQERDMGMAFGYIFQALQSIQKGLNKIEAHEQVIREELTERWALLAEPIQTEMRLYDIQGGYELLKSKTQGKVVTKEIIHEVINESTLPQVAKDKLLALTPETYIGLAPELTKECVENIKHSLVDKKQSRMTAIQGEQWGDEGKGKITDMLASKYDIVVRYNGGANAGHSMQLDDSDTKIHTHLMPSGILTPGVVNVIANGVVLDPWQLQKEIDALREQGLKVNKDNLKISKRCHLVMPYHKLEDAINEAILSKKGEAVGTTKKGIGPTYAEKDNRSYALRFDDLFLPSDKLHQKIESIVRKKKAMLKALVEEYNLSDTKTHITLPNNTEIDALDADSIYKELMVLREKLQPHTTDTTEYLKQAQLDGKSLLFEGANAIMLDKDFGTYPFCTSSNSSTNGIFTGTGLPPQKIDDVIAIVKSYTTRVGAGPFVTELKEDDSASPSRESTLAKSIRKKGHEFGTTTGRSRRIGYLDLQQLKYSLTTTGASAISMMLFDVISNQGSLKVCTGYMLDGKKLPFGEMPASLDELARVEPIYEHFDGFDEVANCTSFAELPKAAQGYLCFVEQTLETPIQYISIGPKRSQTLYVKEGVINERKQLKSASRMVEAMISHSIDASLTKLKLNPQFVEELSKDFSNGNLLKAREAIKQWIQALPHMDSGYQPTFYERKTGVMSQKAALQALNSIPHIESILGSTPKDFISKIQTQQECPAPSGCSVMMSIV